MKKLKVTEITNNSVAMEWESPEFNGGSNITGYDIEIEVNYCFQHFNVLLIIFLIYLMIRVILHPDGQIIRQ